jgi:SAM-dependent methyltransferase
LDDAARVRAAYAADPQREWDRLTSGAQDRLEWVVTRHALARHLPPPDGRRRVLDAGGGPGRYTIALAGQGYRLTLLDLCPALLELARRRIAEAPDAVRGRVEGLVEGSITDLGRFGDGAFDAVLCLGGPLSHLLDPGQRRLAVQELRRVARPGVPLFVSAMNRIAGLRGPVEGWEIDFLDRFLAEYFHTGVVPMSSKPISLYHFWPEELVALLEEQGLAVERLYGTNGIGAHLREEHLLRLMADPGRWPLWEAALLQTCDHPNVVGVSRHLLAVARRPRRNGDG